MVRLGRVRWRSLVPTFAALLLDWKIEGVGPSYGLKSGVARAEAELTVNRPSRSRQLKILRPFRPLHGDIKVTMGVRICSIETGTRNVESSQHQLGAHVSDMMRSSIDLLSRHVPEHERATRVNRQGTEARVFGTNVHFFSSV